MSYTLFVPKSFSRAISWNAIRRSFGAVFKGAVDSMEYFDKRIDHFCKIIYNDQVKHYFESFKNHSNIPEVTNDLKTLFNCLRFKKLIYYYWCRRELVHFHVVHTLWKIICLVMKTCCRNIYLEVINGKLIFDIWEEPKFLEESWFMQKLSPVWNLGKTFKIIFLHRNIRTVCKLSAKNCMKNDVCEILNWSVNKGKKFEK